ncbi:MLX-interacting protein-like isoform X5 [Carettochelys insculpta]|uniref:MLX-interacting protein-like isoform X5 n=1 Tax=Carettochelys insculpta TaxID=44489 RepID=UPI003EBA4492
MSRPQIIHSGHFMVSEPHADPDLDPAGRAVVGSTAEQAGAQEPGAGSWRDEASKGAVTPGTTYDFDTVNTCTCRTYRYGPRSSGALSIDASLTKLFECMTLAYSGKIVSPKWKTFKGLKLLPRDKIRLNNAIWRAWYLQYVERRKNPVCNFVTPLECSDGDDHRKPEAVIMEGKYWKRQIGVVIWEYHKWRTYFCTQVQKKKDKPESLFTQGVVQAAQGEGLSCEAEDTCPMELDLESLISDLADTIFYSRNPYGGPSPRDLAHQGNADMIQPTLTQLHPNFGEDFMDTLDPIHELFASCRPQPGTQVCTPLEPPVGILLMGKPTHPCPATAPLGTDAQAQARAERRGPRAPHQPCRRPGTKGPAGSTSADQARRMNISCAFNALASLVLPGSAQPSVKLSKAMLLQRTAVYVGRLQQERRQVQEMAQRLRGEIEELSAAIGEFQRQLPPSGAPVAPPRSDRTAQLYDDYVRQRTLQNWRFWLFSLLIKPLFESYRGAVSTSTAKEFCQSVLDWLEQHCTLPLLRPAISSSLLQLSKLTAILTKPSCLPEQALQAVCRPPHGKGHS